MNYSLAQIILAGSNDDREDTIWIQMLVLVILAVLVGVGSLVKAGAKKFKNQRGYYPSRASSQGEQLRRQIKSLKEVKDKWLGIFLKTAQAKAIIEKPVFNFDASEAANRRKVENELGVGRDLGGGMEMLELDFLLSIAENTKIDGKNDVMMRKLSFNELVRREQLGAADSNSLKVYAINEGCLYDKDIQCEAMKELAERTGLRSG